VAPPRLLAISGRTTALPTIPIDIGITEYYSYGYESRRKERDMPAEHEVITFKADRELLDAMKGIANRSAFIRQAILAALDSTCPVCSGTGVLTPSQRSHWEEFAKNHHIEQCDTCSEVHIVCDAQ